MRVLSTLLMATTLALSPAAFAKDGGGGGGGGGGGVSVGAGGGNGGGHGAGGVGLSVGGNAGGNAANAGSNAGGQGKGSADVNVNGRGAPTSTRGQADVTTQGRGGRSATQAATSADLGKLNAAHASLTGRTSAATNSAVGQIRSYEEAKISALAMPQTTAVDRAVRAEAIARANAMLENVANKPVTPSVVTQVDSILGIQSSM